MWRIENPELRKETLDLNSSDQGWRNVTQLFTGEIKLINALELVNWDDDDSQFLICEDCAIVHCKQGDWVRVRRSDSMVLVLPSFDYVWAEVEHERHEYRPPHYLRERGIPYFDRSTFERLNAQNPEFPAFEQIRQLNIREATLLFHWTAPAQVLGVPPQIRVNDGIITGGSKGDYLKRLPNIIHDHYNETSNALLRPLGESDRVISIFLDAAEFIDWKALVVDGSEYRLVVDSKFVVVRDE